MSRHPFANGQLGFDDLLASADDDNHRRAFERETGHLPSTMEEGVPYFRTLLQRHHEAMLQGGVERVMKLREETRHLALRLNKGDPGILAGEDSSGRVLERATAAASGEVPIWGQQGDFEIEARGLRVRIEINGVFSIGSSSCFWPGFAAHAVEFHRPFISETGYRSFLGIYAESTPGIAPNFYARAVIETHIETHRKGRLLRIEPRYRSTHPVSTAVGIRAERVVGVNA